MPSTAKAFEPHLEPAQPTREKSDLDYRLSFLSDSLGRASRGVDTTWNLSNVFETVAAHFRGRNERISSAQRDALLDDIVRAAMTVPAYLPMSYNRDQIDAGMQALAGQVMIWAETHQRTEQRPRDALCDLIAYARMFRNDLHNISLLEEIENRARQRRANVIETLLNSNDSKCAGA